MKVSALDISCIPDTEIPTWSAEPSLMVVGTRLRNISLTSWAVSHLGNIARERAGQATDEKRWAYQKLHVYQSNLTWGGSVEGHYIQRCRTVGLWGPLSLVAGFWCLFGRVTVCRGADLLRPLTFVPSVLCFVLCALCVVCCVSCIVFRVLCLSFVCCVLYRI